ncbi:MAG: response regulator [Alphaproteobacteria bacterium]|nr:response regulator [Alphaproteobacteria bacterium]
MNDRKPHILVVDDDRALRELLHRFLSDHGFAVSGAGSAEEAAAALAQTLPDLAVLDVMMPGDTGFVFLERLRKGEVRPDAARLPVLMLTAMGDPEDRIQGLRRGADDYLSKPFEPEELVLRIRNVLGRATTQAPPAVIRFGPFTFDLASQRLTRGQATVHLTSGEAQLMAVFAAHAGEALSRDFLSSKLTVPATDRTIDVQVTRLRKKLEEDPRQPQYIQTVRHLGYALRVNTGER